MPFDNFYEESDKKIPRWWKFIGFAIGLLFGYFAIPMFLMSMFENDPLMLDEKTVQIKQENLDKLCSNLPTPVEFNLAYKEVPATNKFPVKVIYYFKSGRTLDDLRKFYDNALGLQNWRIAPTSAISYSKDSRVITISKINLGDAEFAITCQENVVFSGSR